MHQISIETDIVIIGGGIAGLWSLNRLKALGYSVILLEADALGAGQTIKSQGIIHGGMKYALKGFLSRSANLIENMPTRWKACLVGDGEIDLRTVKTLSDHQLLFSTGSLSSDLLNFFGSFALNSRVKKLSSTELPSVLQNPEFKGHAYRLNEIVLDTPSLIETLAKPHWDSIYKISADDLQIKLKPSSQQLELEIDYLLLQNNTSSSIQIRAQKYLFLAGESNQILTQSLAQSPEMQVRPLQMVYAKLESNYPLFGHCIDNGMNPRITITSHLAKDGKTVWYMGGQIAEDGAKRTQKEQIAFAQQELHALFPWLEKQSIEWGSFMINRAEPKQTDGKRPENAFLKAIGNVIIAWPTKLALTPVLIDDIIQNMKLQNILPNANTSTKKLSISLPLEKPRIALQAWDI